MTWTIWFQVQPLHLLCPIPILSFYPLHSPHQLFQIVFTELPLPTPLEQVIQFHPRIDDHWKGRIGQLFRTTECRRCTDSSACYCQRQYYLEPYKCYTISTTGYFTASSSSAYATNPPAKKTPEPVNERCTQVVSWLLLQSSSLVNHF